MRGPILNITVRSLPIRNGDVESWEQIFVKSFDVRSLPIRNGDAQCSVNHKEVCPVRP